MRKGQKVRNVDTNEVFESYTAAGQAIFDAGKSKSAKSAACSVFHAANHAGKTAFGSKWELAFDEEAPISTEVTAGIESVPAAESTITADSVSAMAEEFGDSTPADEPVEA
jgi:hypothetical protein